MFVHNHMTPNPVTVHLEAAYPEASELLRKHKIRRLPVLEKNRLVGIVVEKDMLSNQPSPATTLSVYEMYSLLERLKVRQFMTHPVVTVRGDCPMEDAAQIMVERKIGCLPVMDGEQLVGIITETDIFKTLVEVLGGAEGGLRLTLRLPERVGILATITASIAAAGGNIIAVTTSSIQENSYREVTIKEIGADPDTLKDLLQDSETTIVDLRTGSGYEPGLFGL